MASSVREELVELISSKKLVSEETLTKMCETAGYSISDLLI